MVHMVYGNKHQKEFYNSRRMPLHSYNAGGVIKYNISPE